MKIIESYNYDAVNEIIEIIAADYAGNYCIDIVFNDNTKKTVDFKSFLTRSQHPSIAKYLDTSIFKAFDVKDGNLNWNDYDLIFPIQDLYEGIID